MKELVRKINDGRYKLTIEGGERVKIETCLFLLECLQILEVNRIECRDLVDTPFISDEMDDFEFHDVDKAMFEAETGGRD